MESTRQITKAMEMVAATKLRRAQAKVLASRPYFEILYKTVSDIAYYNRDFTSPYFRPRTGNRALFVVIAGDRGLAGGYNSGAIKLCLEKAEGKDLTVLPIGKKALEYFRGHGVALYNEEYAEAGLISVSDCFTLAKSIAHAFVEGEFDEVQLVYTDFVSVLSQSPAIKKLLPLEDQRETSGHHSDTLYEPSAEEVFAAIIPEYLGGQLYGAVCESRCAEQAARRTAMDAATKSAEEMIGELTLKYNRARQAAITQEITEIVAGADA